MYKKCIKCGIEKSLSEFRQFKSKYKLKGQKLKIFYTYYRGDCIICEKALANKNKEKYRLIREQNKEEINKKRDEFHLKFPWMKHIYSARNRCNNPKKDNYKRYGGRGIKCELSNQDGEYLWHRDNADLMDKPNLDRKDGNKNYDIENCQFLDEKIHEQKTQIENNHQCIKITQLDENNNVMKNWSSKSRIICLNGFSWSGLQGALDKNKLYKGFYWQYT